MRSRLFLSLVAAAGLLVAGSAVNAGSLQTATWNTTLQGTTLNITNAAATCTPDPMGNTTQQTITCPGVGLGATGTASSTNYSVSLTVGLFALTQFTTGGAINIHTKAVLGTDTIGIAGTNSMAAASAFVTGGVTVKVAAHAGMGVNASKLTAGVTTLVKVPLSVGKAGTFTGSFYVLLSPHYITVDFYAWTPHTLTFTGLTTKFVALPDVTAQGSFMLTANGGGTVTLVSPSKISIDGPLAQRRTASFTSLTLSYAPEPGTLLLLGAGVAGLVLVGSRKRK
ncbi:MAG: PEP-CTERM sorting domain-containing protein [Myxococcota bacterium]